MEDEVILTVEDIKKILPHRYPFLLIDKIVEFEKAERVVSIKNVTCNEEFFIGHFPERAVMPGVLVMEAMAQTAAVLAKASVEEFSDKTVYLVGANDFKWKKTVVPGDTIRIEVRVKKNRAKMWLVDATATVGSKVVAQGELAAIIS